MSIGVTRVGIGKYGRRALAFLLVAASACLVSLVPAVGAYAADGPCNRTDDEWYICKTYYRGSRAIPLRYGIEYHQSGGWGYEHIHAGHGWSDVRDSWINYTLQSGSDLGNQPNGREKFEANPGNEPGCKFDVFVYFGQISWEPDIRYIETAYGNDFCSIN
jgi:hypothetical protein